MKRLILSAGLALAFVVPGVAQAATPTRQHVREYLHAYDTVRVRFGPKVAGCKLVGDRSGRASCHQSVDDTAVMKSLDVLKRDLAPLAPVVRTKVGTYSAPQRTYTPVSSSSARRSVSTNSGSYSSGGGAGGVPACASESGSNYSTGPLNTNSSSGATGRYQITPSTAANYGCNLSTPGGQDSCAQIIYAHQGASAWVGCGG